LQIACNPGNSPPATVQPGRDEIKHASQAAAYIGALALAHNLPKNAVNPIPHFVSRRQLELEALIKLAA
jgi:hypothetical protein